MRGLWRTTATNVAKKAIFLTACLFIASCDQSQLPLTLQKISPAKPSPLELTRAIYSAHLQLDPHQMKAVADSAPVRDLLLGLMMFNPEGETVPAIGQQFLSEDGKTWQISLDENAYWSNGEKVTAQDFVASWQRLADPANASPLASYLIYMGVKNAKQVISGELPVNELGVVALDNHRLQISLHTSNRQLPKMLAHLALLPTYQGKKPQPDQAFISNGSYKIKSYDKLALQLEAVSPEQPFQTVRYQLITTVQNPDRFDIIENPLEQYAHHEVALPKLCTYFYEFNFADPILKQKEIRQAIRAMISSSEISQGLGIANYRVLPKTMSPDDDRRPSNISVEPLFRQVGIDVQNPLKLTITYDDQGQHSHIAKKMARTLGQSDLFRVQLQGVEWPQLLAKRQQKNFQLIRSGWCADYADPALFLQIFHSASPDNKSGYANPLVDQQLEQLQQNPNAEERERLIFNIAKQLENDVAILPLFQYQRRLSIEPDIHGVLHHNSSQVIYSKDLYRQ